MNKKIYLLIFILIISLVLNIVLFFQNFQSKEFNRFEITLSHQITDDVISGTVEMKIYDTTGDEKCSYNSDFCISPSTGSDRVIWEEYSNSNSCFKDGYSMKIHITAWSFLGEERVEYDYSTPLSDSVYSYYIGFGISRSADGLIIKQGV